MKNIHYKKITIKKNIIIHSMNVLFQFFVLLEKILLVDIEICTEYILAVAFCWKTTFYM